MTTDRPIVPNEAALRTHGFTRRTLLVGAAAGAVMIACGGTEDSSRPDQAAVSLDDGKGLALVRFFADPSVLVGSSRRIVYGLAQADGTLRDSGPDTIDAELLDAAGSSLGPVQGTRRARELFRQYYQFRVDVPVEGIYTLRVTADGETAEASFSVVGPEALPFPAPGATFPPFDTPTTDDARGVEPLCTRSPPCEFHQQTLTDALGAAKPIAYLVGTPAHCDTGVCGPMLDVMISLRDRYPGVVFLHAEVYTDDTATIVAPAVEAAGLTFEPVLFLIDADGTLRDRLDVIFDATELEEQLNALIA